MELKDLTKFIKREDKRLRAKFGNYKDEEKRILARTVKLSEESGCIDNNAVACRSDESGY